MWMSTKKELIDKQVQFWVWMALTEQIGQLSAEDYPQVVAASSDVPRLFDDENFAAGIERLIAAVRLETSGA